jgi:hypothetical protein
VVAQGDLLSVVLASKQEGQAENSDDQVSAAQWAELSEWVVMLGL